MYARGAAAPSRPVTSIVPGALNMPPPIVMFTMLAASPQTPRARTSPASPGPRVMTRSGRERDVPRKSDSCYNTRPRARDSPPFSRLVRTTRRPDMLARLRVLSLLIVVIVAAPAHARAQQAGNTPASPASSAAGPRRDLTATAVRQITGAATTASAALAKQKNVGRPAALMIVGGAAIVLGLLIGEAIGTLFVVGGAVAVLVGLYQYLQ